MAWTAWSRTDQGVRRIEGGGVHGHRSGGAVGLLRTPTTGGGGGVDRPYIAGGCIWWPRRVLCALWTRRPIVKFAMGCHTEPAAVHIELYCKGCNFFNFSIFFYNLHNLPQKKLHDEAIFSYTTYIFHPQEEEPPPPPSPCTV